MIMDILIDKIEQMKNPTVVGLDPRLDYVPDYIKEEAFARYGETTQGAAEAFYQFNKGIIDEICNIVPVVKPQVAMYEQYGAQGIDAYIRTIQYAKQKSMLVIGDIKRSDIASTAEAYADGHIGRVPIGKASEEVYREDFITLNPYLGSDSITPYLENCRAFDKGLFILVKTSNPYSGEIQDLQTDGRCIYEVVGELVSKWGEGLIGRHGYSAVGAVVGATYPAQLEQLRACMPHTFFLVPGYGAQGATASELAVGFDKNGNGAIINSSRGIIAAYQKKPYSHDFSALDYAKAARQAALDMKEELLCAKG